MHYDEFFAQYKRAYELWTFGRLDVDGALAELERLRPIAHAVEPADRRATADCLLAQWANETSPAAEDRMARATTALTRASADGGTAAERKARAEAGIAEITAIANETTDVAERYAVLGLNETLAKLVDALDREGLR
ncbi:hypothetical protein ACFV9C_26085 [Kribbella sp. NPDC059898]|uniref:hypothetical protein n=1 Tax=Kribbella sp. NPDC059898 TaxID=3346995 RepID=UPI003666164F